MKHKAAFEEAIKILLPSHLSDNERAIAHLAWFGAEQYYESRRCDGCLHWFELSDRNIPLHGCHKNKGIDWCDEDFGCKH